MTLLCFRENGWRLIAGFVLALGTTNSRAEINSHSLPNKAPSSNVVVFEKPEPEKTKAEGLNTGPLLIMQDPSLKACTVDSGALVRSVWNVELFSAQLDELYQSIEEKVRANPKMKDDDFKSLLDSAGEMAREARNFVIEESNAVEIDYVKTESSRLLSEFYLKLSLAQVTDNKHSLKLYELGKKALKTSVEELGAISGAQRSERYPALLGQNTQTQLSFVQARALRPSLGKLSKNEVSRQMQTIFSDSRKIANRPVELSDLDLLEIESLMSASKTDIGAYSTHLQNRKADEDYLKQLVSKIPEHEARMNSQNEPDHFINNIHERAETLKLLAPFYIESRKGMIRGLDQLQAELKQPEGSDALFRAERSLDFLAREHVGSYAGLKLATMGEEHHKTHPNFDDGPMKFSREEMRRAYDSSLKEQVGDEFIKTFKIPSFSELERGEGMLAQNFQEFSDRITSYAQLQLKIKKEKRKPTKEEARDIEMLSEGIDVSWTYMQCLRVAQQPASKKTVKLKSPFGSMSMDFSRCQGHSALQATKVAGDLVGEKAASNYTKDVAWAFGNFAFDVSTVLATGGLSLLVKKTATKIAARAIGGAALRAGLTKSGAKLVMQSTKFVTGALVVDGAVQVASGSRNFVQSGLQNDDWHFDNFKDSVVYLNPDTWSLKGAGKTMARIAAIGISGAAVNKLWTKGANLPLFKESSFLKNQFEKSWSKDYAIEAVKGTTGLQLQGVARAVAEAPFIPDGGESIKSEAEKIVSLDGWTSRLEMAVYGKIGRKVAGGFSDRMGSVKGGIAGNRVALERLSQCFTRINSSSFSGKAQ